MDGSPFKFLKAYKKEDARFFFGRDEETATLYEMTFHSRLILLYGASGTGKTSLIQAGLANKFSATRWKDLMVRRNDDILESLDLALRSELQIAGEQAPHEFPEPLEAIRRLYQLTFLPLYLIFDQLEELFILHPTDAEKERFFTFIQQLLETDLPCQVILVIREGFLAHLWNYEQLVPSLFDHRFRVERMRLGQLEEVIAGTLHIFQEDGKLRVDQPEAVAEGILQQLSVAETGVELTYLQVYFDRLYQLARTQTPADPVVFHPGLVRELGKVEDVIGEFLDEQLQRFEAQLPEERKGVPILILGALVSDEQTKKVLNRADLEAVRHKRKLSPEELEAFLATFEGGRILRRYTVQSDVKIELTHDIIAQKIWERLPDIDKQLRQIKRSLVQRQQDYVAGRGSFLGETELNAWEYYLPRIELDPDTERYVHDSQADRDEKRQAEARRIQREKEQIQTNRRLQRRIGWGLTVFGVIVGIFLVATIIAQYQLRAAREKIIKSTLESSARRVYTLDYESALDLLREAYELNPENEQVGQALLEIAYVFNESGDLQRASRLFDTLTVPYHYSISTNGSMDAATLRDHFYQMDSIALQALDKRYYPEMIEITGGSFIMGCDSSLMQDCPPAAQPPHRQEVSNFRIAQTETTVWQYYLFVKSRGNEFPEPPSWGWLGDYPMVNVSKDSATRYTAWLREHHPSRVGANFRLPSETEWEYAAKDGPAGTPHKYSGSNNLDRVAWNNKSSPSSPQPVGKLGANQWGLYDMSGNVWEWCYDAYRDYPLEPETIHEGRFDVLRGGSFTSGATRMLVTSRLQMFPKDKKESYGFRPAVGKPLN